MDAFHRPNVHVGAVPQPPNELSVVGCPPAERRFGRIRLGTEAFDARKQVGDNGHGAEHTRGIIPRSRGYVPVTPKGVSWDARRMTTRLVANIKRRMELLGIETMKELGDRAGLKETYVKDIFSGKSKNPTGTKLKQLAEKGLGCSADDLLSEQPKRRAAEAAVDANTVAINELDVHIAAGSGITEDAGGLMAAHEHASVVGVHTYPADSFREAYGVNPGRIRIIPVRGTSMEPELWSGQRVMVDIQDQAPSPPGIFVVWDGLGLVLKYVEVVPNSDPLRVRISSAHQAFKPYERNLEEAYINGRVIGVWKRM